MSRTIQKFISLLSIILLTAITVNAQTNYKPIIYKAYINGDMNKWAAVISTLEKQHLSTVDNKLELISYYYGYTAFLLGTKKHDLAQKNLELGEKHIDALIKTSPKNASAYAFKASFIGFKIGLSKFKAISLGPESNRNVNRSLEIEPLNIQGNVDKANTLYHTPKLFGGNKEEALKLYRKAVQLIEKSGNTQQNWFYLNVLTLTARAHESLDQLPQAKLMYEKVLRIEPEYKWVKNELYPTLLKKI